MGGNVLLESFTGSAARGTRGGCHRVLECECVRECAGSLGYGFVYGFGYEFLDTAVCEKRVKKSKCQEFVYLNKSNNQLSDVYTHTHAYINKERERGRVTVCEK